MSAPILSSDPSGVDATAAAVVYPAASAAAAEAGVGSAAAAAQPNNSGEALKVFDSKEEAVAAGEELGKSIGLGIKHAGQAVASGVSSIAHAVGLGGGSAASSPAAAAQEQKNEATQTADAPTEVPLSTV